jgi:hypothetical protein
MPDVVVDISVLLSVSGINFILFFVVAHECIIIAYMHMIFYYFAWIE